MSAFVCVCAFYEPKSYSLKLNSINAKWITAITAKKQQQQQKTKPKDTQTLMITVPMSSSERKKKKPVFLWWRLCIGFAWPKIDICTQKCVYVCVYLHVKGYCMKSDFKNSLIYYDSTNLSFLNLFTTNYARAPWWLINTPLSQLRQSAVLVQATFKHFDTHWAPFVVYTIFLFLKSPFIHKKKFPAYD